MATPLPEPLRDKLGDEAADGLAGYLHSSLENQKIQVLELVEERMARYVAESETRVRRDMADGFDRLEIRLEKRFEKIDERFEKVDERFQKMDERFSQRLLHMSDLFHEKLGQIQHEITLQTRWFIAVVTFIAVVFKLLDIFAP